MARAETDMRAIEVSPLNFPLERSRNTAAIIVNGMATAIGARLRAEAIAMAPKAT